MSNSISNIFDSCLNILRWKNKNTKDKKESESIHSKASKIRKKSSRVYFVHILTLILRQTFFYVKLCKSKNFRTAEVYESYRNEKDLKLRIKLSISLTGSTAHLSTGDHHPVAEQSGEATVTRPRPAVCQQEPEDYKCDCFQPDHLHYACTDVTLQTHNVHTLSSRNKTNF